MSGREIVAKILENRKRKNPTYSLRAMARDSGIHQSLLSRIRGNTRPFTYRQAEKLKRNMRLSREELSLISKLFDLKPDSRGKEAEAARDPGAWLSALRKEIGRRPFREVSDVEFDLDWKELAILNLTLLEDFEPDVVRIGRRLGIRPVEAAEAIEHLLRRGLLLVESGRLRKRHEKMLFTREKSMEAIRRFHRQMIGKALEELGRTETPRVERRLINGYTIAVDPSRIAEARRRIDAFQQELTDFLSAGKRTELYQLNSQFFPLTVSK